MKVKVICRDTIKPFHPTPKHLHYLKASLFDSINSPILVPLIYFYSLSFPSTNTLLDTLKTSLSHTLSLFYPLAGRLIDTNGIHCNDAGVPYVEAEVTDTRFDDIVHKADVFELDPLQPHQVQHGFSSFLLVIQVTTFPCGGLSIGLKMNHLIADGISLVMFVNTWASIAKGKHPATLIPRPCFDIWKVFPQHHAKNVNILRLSKFNSKPLSKRFLVSKHKLIDLRAKLYDINRDKSNVPSLFMVLSAFIWSRVSMIRWANNDTRPCTAYQSVNLRTKVEAPKNCYYFGNLVAVAGVETSMSQLLLDTNNASHTNHVCGYLLTLMNQSVNKVLKNDFISEIRQGREELKYIKEMRERVFKNEITLLKFSNLRSLPAYDADFGWGRPVWVSSGSWPIIDTIFLTPACPWTSQDVIELYINMIPKEIDLLETDMEFSFFVSKPSGITRNSKL